MIEIKKVVISGGGTGGHIFPAIAIANQIKLKHPKAEILFIGAEGRMEMEKVPAAGYAIEGLWISGFQRRFSLSNLLLPFKIMASLIKARRILKKFDPDVVIGVGGYASGPTLKVATQLGIPTVIQEQNSFPGKTNKILAPNVNAICVAYEGLEKYFPKSKLVLTGNPVRKDVVDIAGKRKAALDFFGLTEEQPVVFVVGGSLGARCLNESVKNNLDKIAEAGIQVIWQCGKNNFETLQSDLKEKLPKGIVMKDFISRMDFAYAAADVIVSRAGAMAVSELCLIGKPTILVPSPYVAEDHQTKNAMSLVDKGAAVLVKEVDTLEDLIPEILGLLKDETRMQELGEKIQTLAVLNSDEKILDVIEEVVG
jgi:UDP-N-acetylglucosamine--N-acetylmuramyl-(pentapeptide) pyrophosphoryl-undecaprenol N-acetylglucosamine transferase